MLFWFFFANTYFHFCQHFLRNLNITSKTIHEKRNYLVDKIYIFWLKFPIKWQQQFKFPKITVQYYTADLPPLRPHCGEATGRDSNPGRGSLEEGTLTTRPLDASFSYLLLGHPQCVKLEEQAEGWRDDTTSWNATHAPSHTSLACQNTLLGY